MADEAVPSIFGKGRQPTGILHLKGIAFFFFALPRELRDHIYDELMDCAKRIKTNRICRRLEIRGLPYEHLLRINHQFRDEFYERYRLLGSPYMFIEDQMSTNVTFRIPRHLEHVRHIEMHIGLLCAHEHSQNGCDIPRRLPEVRKYAVRPIMAHRNSPSLSLSLYISPRRDRADCEERLLKQQGKIADLMRDGCLKSLRVYTSKPEYENRYRVPWPMEKAQDRTLIMQYSHEDHELKRVAKSREKRRLRDEIPLP